MIKYDFGAYNKDMGPALIPATSTQIAGISRRILNEL